MGQKMTNIAKPIIKQIKDNREALDFFEKVSLPAEDEKPRRMYFIIMSDFMCNPVWLFILWIILKYKVLVFMAGALYFCMICKFLVRF